jgi:hypothetical protein
VLVLAGKRAVAMESHVGSLHGAVRRASRGATGVFFAQQMLFLPGAVVLLGGLVGLYAKQSEAAGRLGFVGFLVAFLGTALPWGISASVGMCAC